ncbi:Orn/Lys/Arg decarboxylase N-terminal domain-containing protein [Paeniglutamicibacter cryotolerans]|uniref:Arginine/lysine/ornithine decarboxylase n=1 Tax=Paeniglutamicibacter cryotolerans TaxID=670079 RepID=A0A839QM33_9MICC|nr:Orn/Lys/Arg decarboxylase N-terminal domain-containing protein [Paeniglutamicibacter cryotolerans]MBB2995665.1 arginine/lysine/ornithine decarboxylase [Paeniglutamicibacter cryotolerans]
MLDNVAIKVLIITDPGAGSGTYREALETLLGELTQLEVVVRRSTDADDATLALGSDASFDAVVVDVVGALDAETIVPAIRHRNDHIPVFVASGVRGAEDLSASVLARINQFIYLLDDTPEWIAGRIHDAAQKYRRAVLPPMFEALVDFSTTHEYSWHTPGHEGGTAFLKSPVGRAFWGFFGQQMFRSDLSVSVAEVGSLLDHSGPIGRAERRAAHVFGADMTFFVTNGTSTSNRVVHQASVTAGEVMALDRNAHKSMEQATTITHGLPIYLRPTRNHLGIIGPIPPSEMTAQAIAEKVRTSPLISDSEARPVIAMVTNSTYDGLLYHVPTVEATLGSHIDRLHFDEAWYGYAAFNPIYAERFALHTADRAADAPTTFATQSTHKLLAALSQASYVHIRNGRRPIDHDLFNEAFMMHASTSPLYAIIASNDVAAAMMAGSGGLALTAESIAEAVAFRRTLARVAAEEGPGGWMPRPWQPETVLGADGIVRLFHDADEQQLITRPEPWLLRENDAWHGFQLPDAYAMLDPIKVTVTTPGLANDGTPEQFGVPAAILSAYLDEQASIVVEKTQDYSVLFLFSIGVTRGKWGTLLSTLLQFKHDVDANKRLEEVLPALYSSNSRRYARMGLRDLAGQMHTAMSENRQLAALHEAFATLPTPVLSPADAYARLVHGETDRIKIDDLASHTLAVGIVPYPPGIPLMMPGEESGSSSGPLVSYLKALQGFDRQFPGFEHEIHGIDHVDGAYVTHVIRTDHV